MLGWVQGGHFVHLCEAWGPGRCLLHSANCWGRLSSATLYCASSQVDLAELEPRLQRIGCKIVDFGNACWTHHHFSEDIQTRPYRSPEVGPQPRRSCPAAQHSSEWVAGALRLTIAGIPNLTIPAEVAERLLTYGVHASSLPLRLPTQVILGASYSDSADMWSLACMVFELVTGDYLFHPLGDGERDKDVQQLAQVGAKRAAALGWGVRRRI